MRPSQVRLLVLPALMCIETGQVYTWGFKYGGRLGFGEFSDDDEHPIAPLPVPALSGKVVTQVACGGSHTLVLVSVEHPL